MFEQCSQERDRRELASPTAATASSASPARRRSASVPPPPKGFDYTRQGCNDNLFVAQRPLLRGGPRARDDVQLRQPDPREPVRRQRDLRHLGRLLAGHAASTRTSSRATATMGYGLERGGVNIEHGYKNRIEANEFNEQPVRRPPLVVGQQGLPARSPGAPPTTGLHARTSITDNTFDCDARCRCTSGPPRRLPSSENRSTASEASIDADAALDDRPADGRRSTPAGKPSTRHRSATQDPVGARPAPRPREHHHDRVGAVGSREPARPRSLDEGSPSTSTRSTPS